MAKERFSYRITRNGKLFVHWRGKQGKREIVLKGARAEKLVRELPARDPKQQQLVLARVPGNFKRGNERPLSSRQLEARQHRDGSFSPPG
jgi:hypothetical protein